MSLKENDTYMENLRDMLEEANQELFDADFMNQGHNWVGRASITIGELI